MTFTLTTAIREIIWADHAMQPYEGHHLSVEGFKLERGLWVRRTYLEPRDFDLVFMVPGRHRPKRLEAMKKDDVEGEKLVATQDDPR